jgi:hypothetical protein
VLPALVRLDPLVADGPDAAERMVYASAVADWFDTAIFPLIQLAPQGKWRDWMSWLTMAGVAIVRIGLGKNPTLETWRLLAEDLGNIDLTMLADALASAGAPEELVEAAGDYVPPDDDSFEGNAYHSPLRGQPGVIQFEDGSWGYPYPDRPAYGYAAD